MLIAEDNPVNQQVLLRQVQRLGIIAEAVDNGAGGARRARAGHLRRGADGLPDAGDGRLRGDARDPRARAARARRRMPIVAVTANAMREDFERCREAGMDDFVAKPVTLARSPTRSSARSAPAGTSAGDAAPAAPTRPPSGGVDMAALASLQEDLGGPDALARIVRLFLEQLDPQAEQIDASARGGEHESLARIAHRMRSSAATLGATAMADMLAALEAAALDGDAAACDQLAAAFAAQVASTRGDLRDGARGARRGGPRRRLSAGTRAGCASAANRSRRRTRSRAAPTGGRDRVEEVRRLGRRRGGRRSCSP